MKEHVQKTGVRKYAGDDLIELQAEPLKVIQAFFKECGDCVINGCEVVAVGDKYNVSPGVVSLSGVDAEGKQVAKVATFAGVENVTLPIYLTLANTVSERVYGDGKVKPIAYNYTATATNVHPEEGVSFLEITTTGGKQFVDAIKVTEKLDKIGNGKEVTVTFAAAAERVNVSSGEKLSGLFGKIQKWFAGLKTVAFTGKAADLTQDANNRLVTDTEKTGWNDKYTKTQTDTKDDDTLKAAKTHATNAVNTLSGDVYHKADTYNRTEINNKDATTLQAAKEYAAAKIAEIVNSAPGTLDTLQELAKALGNDPNFATSITALIGGKADRVHGHAISEVTNLQSELDGKAAKNGNKAELFTANAFFTNKREVSFNRPRSSGIEMLSACTENVEGSPGVWFSALSALSDYVGFQVATFGGFTEDLRFRKQTDNNGVWTAWREIWHSGNFNPDNILALKAKVVTEDEAIPDKFCSFQVFHCVRTSVGGTDGYIWAQRWANGNFVTQIFVDADPTNLIAIRTRGNDGVWTSWKKSATQDQLNLKADSDHNHGDTYAPKEHSHNYAASDHNHTGTYESAFKKNSAFNKNFGTAAGTVAQGNHTHPSNILCTGKVKRDGGVWFITPGFTISRTGKGAYKIMHNIGNFNYGFIGTGFDSTTERASFIGMSMQGINYCEIKSYWGSDGFHDSDFSFIIFGWL